MERFQDDRTEEQRQRLTWGVKMRDSFLSGWGPGRDAGGSIAIWACEHRHLEAVERWVSSRSDATYVAVLSLKGFTAGRARSNYREQLVHVYAVEEGHPSLASAAPEGVAHG